MESVLFIRVMHISLLSDNPGQSKAALFTKNTGKRDLCHMVAAWDFFLFMVGYFSDRNEDLREGERAKLGRKSQNEVNSSGGQRRWIGSDRRQRGGHGSVQNLQRRPENGAANWDRWRRRRRSSTFQAGRRRARSQTPVVPAEDAAAARRLLWPRRHTYRNIPAKMRTEKDASVPPDPIS